jgi:ATP-dependent DNA helicase DinG
MAFDSVEMRCPKCKRTLDHPVLPSSDGRLMAICRHPACKFKWPVRGRVVDASSRFSQVQPSVERVGTKATTLPETVPGKDQAAAKAPTYTHTDRMKQVFDKYIRPLKKEYRERPIQLRLAGRIHAAYVHARILLAEAGVGTGKTFAYLVPLFYFLRKRRFASRGPVVICTKTINLMDQMLAKDLPFVQKAFSEETVFHQQTLNVAVMKGQRHYLCLKRLHNTSLGFLSRPRREAVLKWADETTTGDRAEDIPKTLSDAEWHRINVSECDADSCHYKSDCRFLRARERVRDQIEGVIVTNHNLLAEHLAKVQRKQGGLWISPAAVIIDEAHALEASFRQQLSFRLNRKTFEQLTRYLGNNADILDYLVGVDTDDLLPLSERFFAMLFASRKIDDPLDDGRGRYPIELTQELNETIQSIREIVGDLIATTETALNNRGYRASDLEGEAVKTRRRLRRVQRIAERVAEAIDQFLQVVDGTGTTHAAWLDMDSGQPELVVAPLDVSGLLKSGLWSTGIPVVLTSGTLTGADDFEAISDRLGLTDNPRVKAFADESTFDYANRVRIYVPKHLPRPQSQLGDGEDDAFTEAVKVEVGRLLQVSGGRALCLFTSYKRLLATHEYLSTLGLPFKILAQGQGNNGALLDEFRQDQTSVLLATGSFWEGADVEGDSLTLVIMDKLPYPNPQDPLIMAQTDQAVREGKDPHETVYTPNMVTMLRQGAGRLVRKETDWGVIALLDSRANSRSKRELIQGALPPAPWTDDPEEVKRWFHQNGPLGEP